MTPHEKFVQSLGCCTCGRDAQVHHLLRVPGRHMMGKRAGEMFCIGLCPDHHAALHSMGDEAVFMATHKLNGEWLAGALWAVGIGSQAGNEYDASDTENEALELIALARYGRP